MNSSDSEDFESADEDLEENKPKENKTEIENDKLTVNKRRGDDNNVNISSVRNLTEVLQNVKAINLNYESVNNGNKIVPKIEDKPDHTTESIGVVSFKTEVMKPKVLVRKLGSKLRNESTAKREEDENASGTENQNQNNLIEKKIKPMKLGTILTSKEKKLNVNEDAKGLLPASNKASSCNEEETCINKDKGSIWKDNDCDEIAVKSTPTDSKPEYVNFEAGDGWEHEEEDGFEIPVTLAKNGDGGIQCPQEQISELDQVELRKPKTEQEQGWGGWGVWGVSSLLSTATGTVTTFSSHVSAGLSTVLETSVGAPSPETLAAEHAPLQETKGEPTKTEDELVTGYSGLGSIVSGVSFLGTSVINRGLDTLETIGKKTMEVLQEGDPGLKKKRAMLFCDEDKPILSQILREAKERADNSDKEKEEKDAARKIHFESLFDDFQGMVHLEALEMLSTQCELKLQSLQHSLSGSDLLDLQETISQVRDLCEVPEEEEEALNAEQFAEIITNCIELLRINITPTKIIKVNIKICKRLEQLSGSQSANLVIESAISSLAELTAVAMEGFHKSAELVMAKPTHNTADEADSYVQLTNHLCARISVVANEFTQLLTKNDPIANSALITNIFLEASNSCSYIKNACQLLVPILQVGAVAV